jgi:hypothetical protein
MVGLGSSGNGSLPPVSGLHAVDMGVLNGGANGVFPVDPGLLSPNASLAPIPSTSAQRDDTNMKMLAALATGILIGFIIARLFF